MPRFAPRTQCRVPLQVEQLEARHLLATFQPNAAAQLFLEELNNARANPAAYGASIGVDLSGVAPAPPLAFNTELIQAAQWHSQDMNHNSYFAHTSPAGVNPGKRIRNTGFAWTTWHESIAGGSAFPTSSNALQALITDAGIPSLDHREQLLNIGTVFANEKQVGIGVVLGGRGSLQNYYTVDTAATTDKRAFLTGVVYNDANANDRYDLNEGLGGVRISVAGAGSTITFTTGGYSIPLRPGTYTVTASGGGLAGPLSRTFTIGTSNVRLDFTPRNEEFVRSLYLHELGRAPNDSEVNSWINVIGNIGQLGVATAIAHSLEAHMHQVRAWYRTYVGRSPSDGEASGWAAALAVGATEEALIAGILGSPEFYAHAQKIIAAGSADDRYVAALYELLLKRTAAPADLASWAGALPMLGREGVALRFLTSTEYRSDQVAGFYAGLLNRKAWPGIAGLTDWVNSDLDLAAIRLSFEAREEFWFRA
jgi:uncharacterized protein YkwD